MKPSRSRVRWSGRRLASYLLLLTALGLALSGVMLFFKPQGRVAHSLGWRLLGLSKDQWEEVHTSLSALFLVVAGWHLWLNYRAFWGYFKGFLARTWGAKAELILALAFFGLTWVGTLRAWPPFRLFPHWRSEIMAYWRALDQARSLVPTEEDIRVIPEHIQPPTAHKQQGGLGRLSLAEYCLERGIDLEAAKARLAERGVAVQGSDRLREVAERARLHPRELEAFFKGP